MKILIQNGRVVDPSQKLDANLDVLIENGKIVGVGKPGSFANQISSQPRISGASTTASPARSEADQIIDATGLLVTPGLIDVHVHLREPGQESKETIETGLKAAVTGGFTSVACMANTAPVNDNPLVTKLILEKAEDVDLARVFPIGAVSRGLKGEELADIGMMKAAGVCALSDDGMPVMNSDLMRRAMEYARTFNLPVISHAEDLNLSKGAPMNEGAVSALLGYRGNPNASEEIMVAREIALAKLTGARVHIAHLSTKEGLDQVRRAKELGVNITAEVTPHHLVLNDHSLLKGGHACTHSHAQTDYKMAPPLRSESDQAALLDALNSGLIDMIGSDHAPHGCVDKEAEFEMAANGILGLQTTLPLILELVDSKKLGLNRAIEALTACPAKLLNKTDIGNLKAGSHADITLIDLNKTWKLEPENVVSKSTNSPFLGREFKTKVRMTLVGGQIKYDSEK